MKEKFLLSGYTKRESKGVYSVELDLEAGKLSHLSEVVAVSGPTYLTLDQQNHLYTVSKVADKGGLSAFQFNGTTASALNDVVSPGASNCYVAVDEGRGLVYGANYHLGEVRVYKRRADGSLELADSLKHEDQHGPKPEQTGPLCHYSDLAPDNRLVVCDLGNDAVYVYDVDDEKGKLTEHSIYHSQAGSGCRHLTFAADGHTAYLACELDSTVEVLDYADGQLSLLQKTTTLPASHTGFNGVAAIRLSNDGKFLYVSNRGHDSLAIFSVSGKSIELLEIIPTEGHIPRDFNFSHNQNYVIVAHQESDNLTLFKRDKTSGRLTLLQKDFYAPEITCVFPA